MKNHSCVYVLVLEEARYIEKETEREKERVTERPYEGRKGERERK